MQRSRSASKIQYMTQDWPDNMSMTEEAFTEYAFNQEKDEFEMDIRNMSHTLHQLVTAREDTIEKLRKSADYLDSVWYGCKISKSVGTSASVIGGGLTIAGGILTIATAGAATPLLIAGVATSSVGAATNISTSVVEKAISSKEMRAMSNALTIDRDLTMKIESQIDDLGRFKDSLHLGSLLAMAELILGKTHIIVAILESVFNYDSTGLLSLSGRFFSEGLRYSIEAVAKANVASKSLQTIARDGAAMVRDSNVTELMKNNPKVAATAAAGAAAAGAAIIAASAVEKSGSSVATTAVARQGARAAVSSGNQLKYNPLGPEIFLETGKVVGQNSTRLAGKVIVGVSAAFLVWDAVDLGLTLSDLIRKKGSQAGKVLREKAKQLEEALEETRAKFTLDMVDD